jgi:hypothetical protein
MIDNDAGLSCGSGPMNTTDLSILLDNTVQMLEYTSPYDTEDWTAWISGM